MEITVGLSPYDLPDGVRGHRDSSSGKFVIEFRYISNDEPVNSESVDDHVTMYLGKNTDRLYRIDVDIEAMDVDKVNLRVVLPQEIADAFEKLDRRRRFREKLKQRRHLRNHRIAAEVLEKSQQELLANV